MKFKSVLVFLGIIGNFWLGYHVGIQRTVRIATSWLDTVYLYGVDQGKTGHPLSVEEFEKENKLERFLK
jgi:hypothetical protein